MITSVQRRGWSRAEKRGLSRQRSNLAWWHPRWPGPRVIHTSQLFRRRQELCGPRARSAGRLFRRWCLWLSRRGFRQPLEPSRSSLRPALGCGSRGMPMSRQSEAAAPCWPNRLSPVVTPYFDSPAGQPASLRAGKGRNNATIGLRRLHSVELSRAPGCGRARRTRSTESIPASVCGG